MVNKMYKEVIVMKKLHFIIAIIGIVGFCPLYPMTLALKQSLRLQAAPRIKSLNSPRLYSTKIIDNEQSFYRDRNLIASVANVAADCATNYSLLLVPAISQGLHVLSQGLYAAVEGGSPTQINKDLTFLIEINPSIADRVAKIKKITQEIEVLKKDYKPVSFAKKFIAEDRTFYTQNFNCQIQKLECHKDELKSALLDSMSPFFTKYKFALDLERRINEAKNDLETLKIIQNLTKGSRLLSFPFAFLPLVWREAHKDQNKGSIEAASAVFVATFITLVECGSLMLAVEGMSSSIQLLYVTSLALSSRAGYKNWDESTKTLSKMDQRCTNLEYAIEILKIKQNAEISSYK
jgi:hypothetical protein